MQSRSPVVLLVDDHQDSLAMYAFGLLAMGFQPVTATNGDDGFVRACECRPEVIVADVWLPGGSGFDLARRLRADERTHDAAIIVLTGVQRGWEEQQASAAGCDRFLVKPCSPQSLAVAIRDVLAARGARAAAG